MADERFDGKVVVVTGAGSGIGRSTARLFARLGAKVHAADIDGDSASAVAEEIGGGARAHTVDCTDPDAIAAFTEAVFEAERRVDVLHNNAGIGHASAIEETTVDDWQRVIGLNLLGVAYVAQAFIPRLMAQGGPSSIVNTASMAGLVAAPQMAPYCASKFGVVGLTESLNAELAPHDIHVAAICPGIINTPITETAIMHGETEQRRQKAIDFYRKRGASPDAVAAAVVEAVVKHRLVVPVPRSHVVPPWLLKRVSPRASQALARLLPKIVMR